MRADTDNIPAVGDPLPNWSLPTLDGAELHLDSLRGKRILLFMWGSW